MRCGLFGEDDRAWVTQLEENPDNQYSYIGSAWFYRLRGSEWQPTLRMPAAEFIVDFNVRSFGPWRPDRVLLDVYGDGAGGPGTHVVTDGVSVLHTLYSGRGLQPEIEGPYIRDYQPAYVPSDALCCPTGYSTNLVSEIDGVWTAGEIQLTQNPFSEFGVAIEDPAVLSPNGLAGTRFGAPLDAAIGTIRSILRPAYDGAPPVDVASDVTYQDQISVEPGDEWTASSGTYLREVCWPGGLCLYGTIGTDERPSVFTGWTYSVPWLARSDPGDADELRLTAEDGLFLGAPVDLLESERSATILGRSNPSDERGDQVIEIRIPDWPDGSILASGGSMRIVALVAGEHRPVIPRTSTSPPLGSTLAQMQLVDEWSPAAPTWLAFGEGLGERATGSRGPDRRSHVVQRFVVMGENADPQGSDVLQLTSVTAFPPPGDGHYLSSYKCADSALVLVQLFDEDVEGPVRQWEVSSDGVALVSQSPPCAVEIIEGD